MSELVKMKMSANDDGTISIQQVADPINDDDIANKKYVDDSIINTLSNFASFSYSIVSALPAVGSTNVIYFVPTDDPEYNNAYDEYVYIDGAYEKIASTKVNMSEYALKTDVNTAINTAILQVLAGSY